MINTITLITTLGTNIAATMMTTTVTTSLPPITDTTSHMVAIMIHMNNLPILTTGNTLPTILDIMTTRIAVLLPLHAVDTMMNLVMMLTTTAPRDLKVIKVVD